ncbi:MAG: glycosyltransferase family 2 protein [Anaerolineae bacterium]|nr:glycosyltransferase family 2 protein [Anaerolineae bacterium]
MEPREYLNGAILDTMSGSQSNLLLDLSIIIPTRNEAGNIDTLLSRLSKSLNGYGVEVIFVDDSSDDTPQVVEAARQQYPDLKVRMIHREEEQRTGGLGGAVVLGMKNAQSEYACVMDGDLQHPPEMIPSLFYALKEKQVDLVVATRRNQQSQVRGLNFTRNIISRGLDLTARVFFPRRLQGVSDPLSGFFMVRKDSLKMTDLRPNGFKILLEILVRNPKLKKAEVPFSFGERLAGESKASTKEAINYFKQLWTLKFGTSTLRFAGFALVGASGILVNSLVLYLATSRLNIYYLLSVAIATVASTLWNFGLTETLVYRASDQSKGRIQRLALFSVMNIAALALRGPIIYLLTSIFSVNYLVSNLISLVLLTVLRFLTADSMIWGNTRRETLGELKALYSYDIHNIISVVSEGELPEMEPFRVFQTIENPTINVRIGIPPAPRHEKLAHSNYLRFREIFGHLGFEVGIWMGDQVNVVASPLLRYSPHVLYTNVVEPILRWTFVKKGFALVHGATIAFGEQAFMITARTDTGKTTTLLKILSHQRRNSDRAAFLSDDMIIVSPDGSALTYPKPLTISAHTLGAINAETLNFREKMSLPLQSRIHSRSGRKAASFISKTNLPAATINMLMQIVVPPPKYFVEKLLPAVKLQKEANFAGMFIIERNGEGTKTINNKEALEILLSNCEDAYGFPPYNDLKEFLYHRNGVDLRKIEQNIIRQSFAGLAATVVQSKKLDWWCLIPSFIDEKVASDCVCDGNQLAVQPMQSVGGLAGR